MKLKIIKRRKIFLAIAGIVILIGVIGFFAFGLKYSIDFTGGSLMELEFINGKRPDNNAINDALANFSLKSLSIQPIGEKGVILRMENIDEAKHQAILEKLDSWSSSSNNASSTPGILANISEKQFDSIGPSIGSELKTKTIYAVFISLVLIALFITWSFRRVSRRVPSWKYGVCALIALFHDIMLVVGIFVFLGRYYGTVVDVSFIAALLTILGYSVEDTIVIFDRIRENLPKMSGTFEDIVDASINEVFVRSIHASGTTFVSLIPVYLFGGSNIKVFSLALLIGLISGTYSSIFIASPLLVEWQLRSKNQKI